MTYEDEVYWAVPATGAISVAQFSRKARMCTRKHRRMLATPTVALRIALASRSSAHRIRAQIPGRQNKKLLAMRAAKPRP